MCDITDNVLHDCNTNRLLCLCVREWMLTHVRVRVHVLLSLLVCALTQQLATIRTEARHTSVGTHTHTHTHTHIKVTGHWSIMWGCFYFLLRKISEMKQTANRDTLKIKETGKDISV